LRVRRAAAKLLIARTEVHAIAPHLQFAA